MPKQKWSRDVYSEIVDDDKRLNAQKMDDDFYQKVEVKDPEPEAISEEELLLKLLRNLTPEEKQRLLGTL